MELTADQYAKFRDYCKEIRPGEYGRVAISFVGEPSNVVQITVEKNTRFQNEKAGRRHCEKIEFEENRPG
jgi:hypothetical protein